LRNKFKCRTWQGLLVILYCFSRVNLVHFPEDRGSLKKEEKPEEFTHELKQKFYHQEAEIHLIKLSPVTSDLLDFKFSSINFQDVKFEFNEKDQHYMWQSGEDLKGLPLKYMKHIINELKTIGYETERYYYPDNYSFKNVRKVIYNIEKKF